MNSIFSASTPIRHIRESTGDFEHWLGSRLRLIPEDLALKHERMGEDVFSFFRSAFYRFAESWPAVCTDLASAPKLLCIGDLHVENFGTWRDAEGRLTWGINDFDEACEAPYAVDLVRLAASALLAIHGKRLSLKAEAAAASILAGYLQALTGPSKPWVLEEGQEWFRVLAYSEERNPTRFWAKFDSMPTLSAPLPVSLSRKLAATLPQPALDVRMVHRIAGLGSLGRERYVAIGRWHGAHVAREAKAIAPSAWHWASGQAPPAPNQSEQCWNRAIRVPDPFLRIDGEWQIRRLAPHCSRIELSSLPEKKDEDRLLHAMGYETGNVHRGTPKAIAGVIEDLAKRPPDWLLNAANAVIAAVHADWKAWCRS
jgi:hypothetical protein